MAALESDCWLGTQLGLSLWIPQRCFSIQDGALVGGRASMMPDFLYGESSFISVTLPLTNLVNSCVLSKPEVQHLQNGGMITPTVSVGS